MKCSLLLFTAFFILLYSCSPKAEKDSADQWKQEIMETEKNFAQMAADEGIADAFIYYAAENAVLQRNNQLIRGKEELKKFYRAQAGEVNHVHLDWKPDFVDVSDAGDLGYTYGQYTYSYYDSTGTKIESSGIFHTVWKRQPDGNWRFVWD
jgi:ketosteroid isomerase-like protein